jgi:hypothetical protein
MYGHNSLLNNELCNSITPWSKLLPEMVTVPQIVEKFPAFYGSRKFITAFKVPVTCSYPKPEQSSSCIPISLPDVPF